MPTAQHTISALPRIAVVGCGHWGKNLIRNFAGLGALAAVCDPVQSLSQKYADDYRVENLDWQTLLDRTDIPAVVIATPAELHYTHALAALRAGKHVFVEKPLALDIAEAEELCLEAQKRNQVLMVGHLLNYHEGFLQLKKLVQDGQLGRLQYIYSNRASFGIFRRSENILWSFAPHDISMILRLAGEEPVKIAATSAHFLHERIADVTITNLSFANGIKAHVFVSWLHPHKEQKLVVIGDRGMAVFDDIQPWDKKLCLYRHKVEWREGIPTPNKDDGQFIPLQESEPLKAECQHFVESIADRKQPPRTDGWEGLRVLKVLRAAQSSMDDALPSQATGTSAPASNFFAHETAIVDMPSHVGKGSKIWHFSHILRDVVIGENCIVGQNAMIGPNVTVGDNCKIQNNVSLYEGVTLEDNVFCGPSCVFTNVINPRADVNRKNEFKTTVVRHGATIGANATIVCGVELGAYCLIGAGAVVTKDVPAHAVMVGNPARRIGWVGKSGEKLGPELICPADGTRYRESNGILYEIDEKKQAQKK